jgi:hypothetical protein
MARRSSSSSEAPATDEVTAPAAQATPLTHDEKVARFDTKIGVLRAVRYDPIGKPAKQLDAAAKAERVNARLAEMAARG